LARAQEELGSDTLVIRSNAGNVAEIESMMAQVKNHFARLDVLFVNAGIAKPSPIDLVSETQFDEIMGINIKGVYFTIQKALPLLSGNASIIATTSITNQLGSPNFSVYGASKAALRSLVQSLGLEHSSAVEFGSTRSALSRSRPRSSRKWGCPKKLHTKKEGR
jgi:NAD(P)-dependent dehydrogenase (short-subunit alcohol dehydrogenase family)